MADQEFVGISITPEQRQKIEEYAQRQGYKDLDDYLRALIEADVQAHDETFLLEDDAVQAFREGWRDAMTGNTSPASTLWNQFKF